MLVKYSFRLYQIYGSESLIIRILLLLGLFSLSSCGQLTAFLGPAISAGSTGEIYRAGYSFGSDHFIMRVTGKTTMEHITSHMDVMEHITSHMDIE